MQIRMLKKAAFNGKRHESGEIVDAEKGMGEHLILHGLAIAVPPAKIEPIILPELSATTTDNVGVYNVEVYTVAGTTGSPPIPETPTSDATDKVQKKRRR